MKGIDSIKSVIVSEAQGNAQRILEESGKKCAAILEEGKVRADEIMAEIDLALKRESLEIADKTATQGRLNVSRSVLAEKQAQFKEAFKQAEAKLSSYEGDDYINLMTGIIKQNAPKGGEIVMDNPYLEKYGAAIISALGEGYTLSPKAEVLGAGAIVRSGRIEYNCRISAIIQRMADTEAQRVSEILFGV